MDSAKSETIFVNKDQDYADSWAVYSRGRRDQQQIWVSDKIVPNVATVLNGKDDSNILSIGSGNGAFDILILEELTKFLKSEGCGDKKIIYHVLEPNIELLETFKINTEDATLRNLSNVQFLWMNKSFEDHMLHTSQNQVKYDLVVLSHCLYYMNEAEVLRGCLMNLLTKNGLLLVIIGTEGDIWTQLMPRYENKVSSLSSGHHYLTSLTISDLAKSNGWRYESFNGKQNLEITEIFDNNSKVGNKLLEFFFHHENPRESFDQEVLNDILDFFRNAEGNVVENIGEQKRLFARNDDGVVLIYKD